MVSTQIARLLRFQHAQRFASPLSLRVAPIFLVQRQPKSSFSTSTVSRADTPEAQAISEVAKAEGGPVKGSESAKMQSELSKQGNIQQESSNSTKSPEGRAISEVAHAEGGTTKGSLSAKMQSEITKQQNAEQGISGSSSSQNDASAKSPVGHTISEVAHAEGGPTKDSQSAQMQSQATKEINAQERSAGGRPKSPAGQAISEVARAEGGTTKGSQSARMQSELTKAMKIEQGIGRGGGRTSKSPEAQAISEVAYAEGGTTKGSKSAKMQSELAKARNAETGV